MVEIVHVDDSNFELEVLKSELPVLVEYGAVWCSPCAQQLPLLEKFALEKGEQIKVCKVDIDDAPSITSQMGVKSIPTLILFNGGVAVGFKSGLTPLAAIHDFVNSKLKSI